MDPAWLHPLFGVLLVLACVVCWALNVLGLPGNWLVVAVSSIYAYFGPAQGRLDLDWGVIGALGILALAGEAVEFFAGAVGAKQAGGSKRGAVLALAGSLLGGILGLFVGTPIPVIGQLVAAVLFAGLGALGGAVLGEQWKGRKLDESLRIGQAAFWSRLLGTLGKSLIGTVMLMLVVAALLVE
jgi:hypothetical protein